MADLRSLPVGCGGCGFVLNLVASAENPDNYDITPLVGWTIEPGKAALCDRCTGGWVPMQGAAVERLREVLQHVRDELNRWGHGDFHYGPQAQEQSVVNAVTMADRVLKETLDV